MERQERHSVYGSCRHHVVGVDVYGVAGLFQPTVVCEIFPVCK